MWKHRKKAAKLSRARREDSEEMNPAETVILDFWPPESWHSIISIVAPTQFVVLCHGNSSKLVLWACQLTQCDRDNLEQHVDKYPEGKSGFTGMRGTMKWWYLPWVGKEEEAVAALTLDFYYACKLMALTFICQRIFKYFFKIIQWTERIWKLAS